MARLTEYVVENRLQFVVVVVVVDDVDVVVVVSFSKIIIFWTL